MPPMAEAELAEKVRVQRATYQAMLGKVRH